VVCGRHFGTQLSDWQQTCMSISPGFVRVTTRLQFTLLDVRAPRRTADAPRRGRTAVSPMVYRAGTVRCRSTIGCTPAEVGQSTGSPGARRETPRTLRLLPTPSPLWWMLRRCRPCSWIHWRRMWTAAADDDQLRHRTASGSRPARPQSTADSLRPAARTRGTAAGWPAASSSSDVRSGWNRRQCREVRRR